MNINESFFINELLNRINRLVKPKASSMLKSKFKYVYMSV